MSLAQGTFLKNMAFLVLMGRVKLAWHCGKMNIGNKQLFQGIISARLFIIWS